MSKGGQLRIAKTKDLLKPNAYCLALNGEYAQWAFDEERVLELKGQWRAHFGSSDSIPLDLEIGTGNGTHFAHYAKANPNRNLIGLELKFKPLIQSIRRCVRQGSTNARIARYNAVLLDHLFADGELDRILIHFPDPWEKVSKNKHRLIQPHFLEKAFCAQRAGGDIEFKTDSRPYFDWAMDVFTQSPYRIESFSYDLHQSPWAGQNFVTHFESIFLRQKKPICFARLVKDPGSTIARQN